MPYRIIEDGQSFKVVEEVGAVFDDGQWYAKGAAIMELDEKELVINLEDSKRVIPVSQILEPVYTDLDDLYNQVTAIIY